MYRDVQSVKTPGSIERVVVDDETVCKAMVSDTNGLILLGLGQGKTQVKVWLAEDNQAGTRLQQIEVTVREPWEVRASQSVASYADATQSLAELFPTARIAIRSNENGSLTIFGKAESDEQAKQIASLVRKMFLVPVQDRIATATAK
jgi:Flp pilus assembly secretin CpaC